jgi:hypothetical protein
VRFRITVGVFSLCLLVVTCRDARAQNLTYGAPHRVAKTENDYFDLERQRIAENLARQANLERQAAINEDSEKLFKLAGELKDVVGKSSENVCPSTC